jgi:hypothetical protein
MAGRIQWLPTDEEATMREDRCPIGYWIKHLDGLIEVTVDRTLTGQGVTRRHWQALNTLHEDCPPRRRSATLWRRSSPTTR